MSATTKHSNDGGDEGDKKRGRRGSKKQEPEVPSTPKSKGRGQKKKDSEAPATPKTTGRGKKKAVEAVNNDVFLPHVPDAPVPDPTFVPTKFKGFTADFLPSHMTPAVATGAPAASTATLPSAVGPDGRWHCLAPNCRKSFSTKTGLGDHMKAHSNIFTYCPKDDCEFKSGSPYTVTKHIKGKHPEFLGSEEMDDFTAQVAKRNKERVIDEEEIFGGDLQDDSNSKQSKRDVAAAFGQVLDAFKNYDTTTSGKANVRIQLRASALALAAEIEAEQKQEDDDDGAN